MKKQLLGLVAIAIAVISFAFTTVRTDYYFVVTNNTSNPEAAVLSTVDPSTSPACDGLELNICTIKFPNKIQVGSDWKPATTAGVEIPQSDFDLYPRTQREF